MKKTFIVIKLAIAVLLLAVTNYSILISLKGLLAVYNPVGVYSFIGMEFLLGMYFLLSALKDREEESE